MLRRALPVLLIVAASLGCTDQAAPTAVDLTETVAEGETQIVLQELPGPTAGTLTYVVRVIARWEGVASYRGEVSFAPGAFELLGTKTPVGADGEMFLVNPQPAAGRLLFSALTTERFSTTRCCASRSGPSSRCARPSSRPRSASSVTSAVPRSMRGGCAAPMAFAM